MGYCTIHKYLVIYHMDDRESEPHRFDKVSTSRNPYIGLNYSIFIPFDIDMDQIIIDFTDLIRL